VKELYGLLIHTSSTHAGFEFAILPWGDRNFQDNLAPHGWFAAEYRTLLRTMLVREEGDDLHLLSVVSPEWIGSGKTIAVKQAPTNFGEVAFTLEQPSNTEAVLHLDTHFTRAPKQLVIHLPWFVDVKSAMADGKRVDAVRNELVVSPTAKEIHLSWAVKADAPHLSYQRSVDAYKAEYARRYHELIHGAGNQ
jgi:hypothetical protein